jgi:3'(2'), 5'-bisphosphate nucleotidase
VSKRTELRGARVLVSRSRRAVDAEARYEELGLVVEQCGSAGVKGAKVACGEADLYVQPGNAGLLWDSCAPEAIVRAAGGEWRTTFGEASDYARERIVNERGIVTGNEALVTRFLSEWPSS